MNESESIITSFRIINDSETIFFIDHILNLNDDSTKFIVDDEKGIALYINSNGEVFTENNKIGKFYMKMDTTWYFKFDDLETKIDFEMCKLLKCEVELFKHLVRSNIITL